VSPRPYVRNQGFALTAALVVIASVGMPVVAASGAAVTLAIWAALRIPYGRRRLATSFPSTPTRLALDRLVDRVGLAAIVIPTALITALVVLGREQSTSVPAIVAGVSATLVTGGLYWSSLVDWYWILPRVSGLFGVRPCRRSDGDPFPITSWAAVTTWWYGHRTASPVAVFLGAGGLTAAAVGALTRAANADPTLSTVLAVLTGLVPMVAGVVMKRVPAGFSESIRPTFSVGQAYKAATDATPRWVLDVSLEGVGTVNVNEHRERYRQRLAAGLSQFGAPKHDRVVPLADLDKETVAGTAFGDCANGRCSGINWYCVENPRFAEKP